MVGVSEKRTGDSRRALLGIHSLSLIIHCGRSFSLLPHIPADPIRKPTAQLANSL